MPLSARTATGEVDTTHLNAAGSLAFGRLVVDALRRVEPALASSFTPEPADLGRVRIWGAPDAVVAADGSGQYATVQEAINAAPQNTSAANRWTIFVKSGTYREVVYVQREKRFVSIVGEDPARTIVTYDLKASALGLDGQPIGTFRTPTMTIDADDFSVENLTSRTPPARSVRRLRCASTATVWSCATAALGWQTRCSSNQPAVEDTLVAGHVDFIFGGATAFFERCRLHAAEWLPDGLDPGRRAGGFRVRQHEITGAANAKIYLGRPCATSRRSRS